MSTPTAAPTPSARSSRLIRDKNCNSLTALEENVGTSVQRDELAAAHPALVRGPVVNGRLRAVPVAQGSDRGPDVGRRPVGGQGLGVEQRAEARVVELERTLGLDAGQPLAQLEDHTDHDGMDDAVLQRAE